MDHPHIPGTEATYDGVPASQVNRFREEALARVKAYKLVTCTAERWDRMLSLLDLARDHLKHSACIDDDASRCPACALEAQIDEMLEGVR